MREIMAFSVSLLLALPLSGCARGGKTTLPPAARSGSGSGSGTSSSTLTPDEVVISPEQFDQVTILKVGQVFCVKPPIDASRWQVSYDAKIVIALLPPDTMEAPGRQGWRFRVLAEGQTDVVFTSVPKVSSAPPMAARISLTIKGIK